MEKKKKIINLTPHEVRLLDDEGNTVAVFPSEGVVRLEEKKELIGYLEEERVTFGIYDDPYESPSVARIPVYRKEFGATNLPEKREGVYYIVSSLVAQAFPRDDFLVPDQLVRDSEGRVIGARSFAIFSKEVKE